MRSLGKYFKSSFILIATILGLTVDGYSFTETLRSGDRASVISPGYGLADWTPNFIGVWRMEESSGVRFNETGTSCGSNCDLSATAIDQQTTDLVEMLSAAKADSPAGDQKETKLYCDADNDDSGSVDNCTDLYISSGDLSWGGWVDVHATLAIGLYDGQADNSVLAIGNLGDKDADKGYGLTVLGFLQQYFTCVVDDTEVTYAENPWDSNWSYIVCTFDQDTGSGDEELAIFAEASSEGSSSGTIAFTASEVDFHINHVNSSSLYNSLTLDEMFVIDVELTATQICRMCSCSISGKGCTCDSAYGNAGWLSKGRNASYCGSCTLPTYCNKNLGDS